MMESRDKMLDRLFPLKWNTVSRWSWLNGRRIHNV